MGLKTGKAQRLTAPGLAARATALEILFNVLDRHQPFDEALVQHRGIANLSDSDRGFIRQICATTLRRLGQIDALIDCCLDKPLPKRAQDIRYILRIGVAQIAFLKTPSHAAVDTAVNLADVYGFKPQKGFVNALLRRIVKEGEALIVEQDAGRLNTPDWLWQTWCETYGEETTERIATAHLNEPPLDITVKKDAEAWAKKLDGTVLPNGSIRRNGGGAVTGLSGYADGHWWVQDVAASLPVSLFGDVAGKTIIDLCAAPGGKTAQLAHAGAKVIANDRAEGRLKTLRENLNRLGLNAEIVKADSRTWQPSEPADGILIDAPCTATGTIRRHPDIPWLKQPGDIAAVADIQQTLLQSAGSMIKPGGTIIFCTCSLQIEEGPDQISAFLDNTDEISRDPIREDEVFGIQEWLTEAGELRTLPHHWGQYGGMDGFFTARLKRIA